MSWWPQTQHLHQDISSAIKTESDGRGWKRQMRNKRKKKAGFVASDRRQSTSVGINHWLTTSSWFSNQTIVNQKEIKDLKRTHGPIPRSSEGLWQTLPRVPKFRGCVIADRVSNEQLWVCNLKKRQSMNWMSTCHNRKWIIWVCLSRSSLWTARFPI